MKNFSIALLASLLSVLSWAGPTQWSATNGRSGHWFEAINRDLSWSPGRGSALAGNDDGLGDALAGILSADARDLPYSHFRVAAWGSRSDEWGPAGETGIGVSKWTDGPDTLQPVSFAPGASKWTDGLGDQDAVPPPWTVVGGREDYGSDLANPAWPGALLVEPDDSVIPKPAPLALIGLVTAVVALRRPR